MWAGAVSCGKSLHPLFKLVAGESSGSHCQLWPLGPGQGLFLLVASGWRDSFGWPERVPGCLVGPPHGLVHAARRAQGRGGVAVAAVGFHAISLAQAGVHEVAS